MSLRFTVSGGNIRTFLNVLSCVGKIGEAVYLVALQDGIELSAVTPSRNGHISVRIHERCFDSFHFAPTLSTTSGNSDSVEVTETVESEVDHAAAKELFLCLLSKTLMATVLRLHNNTNLQSIEFSYELAPPDTTTFDSTSTATTKGGGDGDAAAIQTEAADSPQQQQKLQETRQSNSVRRNTNFDDEVKHNSDGRSSADMVRWKCTYNRNMTKTFLLRLAEGLPTSVCADPTRYHFEVCGEARTYGSLLASLPSSAGQCGLTLLESGGLELRSVNNAQQQQQQQPASSTRASREGTSGKDAKNSGGAAGADGSATVVTAFASVFQLFRFFDILPPPLARDGEKQTEDAEALPGQARGLAAENDLDASSGPSMVPPTPSPHTQASSEGDRQQQQQRDTPADCETAHQNDLVVKPFVRLPGKVFDVKPFKQAAWLAEQLGVQLRLRCGDAGMPLIFSSITPEEVQVLKAAEDGGNGNARVSSVHASSSLGRPLAAGGRGSMTGVGGGISAPSAYARPTTRSSAAASAAAAAAGLSGGVDAVVVPACVSFAVHVAALDVAAAVGDANATVAGASAAAARGGRDSTNTVTATTSASSMVNTPRASAHLPHPRSSVDARPRHSGVGEEGGQAGDDAAYSSPPPSAFPSQGNSVLASATRSSALAPSTSQRDYEGGEGGLGVSPSGGGSSTAGEASVVQPTPYTHRSHDAFAEKSNTSSRPSLPQLISRESTAHTPYSHVEASFTSTNPTPVQGAVPSDMRRTGQQAPSTVHSAEATPRPSLSAALDVVMVMTGGNTQENALPHHHSLQEKQPQLPQSHSTSAPPSSDFAAAPPALPLMQSSTLHGGLSATTPVTSYTAASLNAMYPLDFEAFARTYTTQADVADEDEEEDAQDAELREFLASCVASMSRDTTQS